MSSFPRRVSLGLRPREGETLDAICGGQVQLLQHRDGYRFNTDPILLAHFAAESPGSVHGPLLELGTGCGIVALILARKFGRRNVTGLEVQPAMFELAQRNVALNRCERRVTLVRADLRRIRQKLAGGAFAHVLCNPPYGSIGAGRINPTEEKAIARHEVLCGLEDVARAAAFALSERGSLWLVYPSARLAELFAVLRAHRLEPRRLRTIHPHAGEDAKRVVVQAVKNGRAPLIVEAPLVLHRADGEFTDEVTRMLSDRPRSSRAEGPRLAAAAVAL